ncbi:DUF2515 family protein [Herbaspirillum frisingense]|uniref:DUF2515 family protein n=1 Tax=Herbaspirillum frisingense TaxID=92645 RepID=UPI001F2B25D6|nr:hypothetical protein [Herbaspirillum frisingense]UIN21254.1 hypothetical protein LAZ82_22845 [Herbaspirillum frisingense]
MGAPDKVQAQTNTTEKSSKEVHCDCNLMWSMIQQMSTKRLCRLHGRNEGSIIPVYSDRARRISATYARFYLEIEDYGDPARKGRFYWMALGAFASKTVACSLDDLRVPIIDPVFKGLAKGNLWLFYDISGWHWYYTRFRDSFDQCVSCRNASAYIKPVKDQVDNYPWKDQALPRIKNMHEHAYIVEGFNLVKQIESTRPGSDQEDLKYRHLLAIANHEQLIILQPLIYDDPSFSRWVGVQRWRLVRPFSPELRLAFSSACDVEDKHMKSVAPSTTKLEDFQSRMKWITTAAGIFHDLMQKQAPYMESQLQAMAGWVGQDQTEDLAQYPLMPPL